MKKLTALTISQVKDVDSDSEQIGNLTTQLVPPRAKRIRDLWSKANGLFNGQGYMPGRGQKTTELVALNGKRLTKHDSVGLFISTARLEPFLEGEVHRRRNSRIYRPPLVLISEGFFESAESIRARLYLGRVPLIYNRSFYGYSTAGHARADELARYLFVLASSDLFAYYILQTSAKFGVERRTVLEEDIGDFPVMVFESIQARRLKRMRQILADFSLDDPSCWTALNEWVNQLYNLTYNDRRVMKETLATRMPFEAATREALRRATPKEKRDFVECVETVLRPFFRSTGDLINLTLLDSGIDTWVIFDMQSGRKATVLPQAITGIALLIADREGSSRVMEEVSSGHLRVAIRNQYRYLTKSRARLCAIDILREKGHLFPISEKCLQS